MRLVGVNSIAELTPGSARMVLLVVGAHSANDCYVGQYETGQVDGCRAVCFRQDDYTTNCYSSTSMSSGVVIGYDTYAVTYFQCDTQWMSKFRGFSLALSY